MKRRHPLQYVNRETRTQASMRRCRDCNGAYFDPIRDKFHRPEDDCASLSCPFWPYYLGRDYYRARKTSPEIEQKMQEWEETQHSLWDPVVREIAGEDQ